MVSNRKIWACIHTELLGTANANPYYTAVSVYIFFCRKCHCLEFFITEIVLVVKFTNSILAIFYSLFITYPALSEQFYFQFQSCEIVFGYILVGVSLTLLFINIGHKKWPILILSVLTATLAFSVYQSFVNVYISACLGCFAFCLIGRYP